MIYAAAIIIGYGLYTVLLKLFFYLVLKPVLFTATMMVKFYFYIKTKRLIFKKVKKEKIKHKELKDKIYHKLHIAE